MKSFFEIRMQSNAFNKNLPNFNLTSSFLNENRNKIVSMDKNATSCIFYRMRWDDEVIWSIRHSLQPKRLGTITAEDVYISSDEENLSEPFEDHIYVLPPKKIKIKDDEHVRWQAQKHSKCHQKIKKVNKSQGRARVEHPAIIYKTLTVNFKKFHQWKVMVHWNKHPKSKLLWQLTHWNIQPHQWQLRLMQWTYIVMNAAKSIWIQLIESWRWFERYR